MSGAEVRSVSGRAVVVPGDDIDTDRIVPARYLRCVTFDGLGEALFRDERFTEDGRSRGHVLDAPEHAGARVMIAGRNFGCGSSREHAPQAIARAGFGAVVAESFAEIFAGNSLGIGLVCATVTAADADRLRAAVESDPSLEVRVDLETMNVTWGGESAPFTMPGDARIALVEGRWDPLFELLAARDAIAATHARLPYIEWNRR